MEQDLIKVRRATRNDVALILAFIQKKSAFDRSVGAFSGTIQTSEEKIAKTLFGAVPFAYVLFAEITNLTVGFALYYFRYSSFAGQPILWLDDLYVDEEMRSKGVGLELMNYLTQVYRDNNCSHLAWTADARNIRGLDFYYRLGAKAIRKQDNRCFLIWKP